MVPIKYLIKKTTLQPVFTGKIFFLQWTTKLPQFNLQSLLNIELHPDKNKQDCKGQCINNNKVK